MKAELRISFKDVRCRIGAPGGRALPGKTGSGLENRVFPHVFGQFPLAGRFSRLGGSLSP